MNIYITLDYELFFGEQSGGVDDCIIKPTNELLKITDPFNIKLVIFVDVGYLYKLEEYKDKFPNLNVDYSKITKQIKLLADNGHGIELHIHPHWEHSTYNGNQWLFNTEQYKLQDFPKEEAYDIVLKYSKLLEKISGIKPVAFRAGGWSAQPFSHIKQALQDAGIYIDSTVFPNGYHKSKHQSYNFKNVPQYLTKYQFEDDLTLPVIEGSFTEYPISSYRLNPAFFWNFALKKLKKDTTHIAFGNGSAISKPKKEVIKLMLQYSNSVVSIDGFKASFLQKAFNSYKKNTHKDDNFVIIGHPKAFSPYSLAKTKQFIDSVYKENVFKTFK